MSFDEQFPGGIRLTVVERCELIDWKDACVDAAIKRTEASHDAMRNGWQPMGLAPEDGTAILALLNDSDVPYAIRYVDDGWEMVWDKYRLINADGPRYWTAIPDDPDA